MSSDTEWRRGGPGKTPIDRVGVWERGTNGRVVDTYTVESLDPFSTPVFRSLSGKPERSVMTLGQWQSSEFEWRFIGPLPTEQPAPEAGGKKEAAKWSSRVLGEAYEAWQTSAKYLPVASWRYIPDRFFTFLKTPSGQSCLDDFLGRDSLVSQLEEARAWKTAVEEHAVVNWNEPALLETDPRKAIGLLVEKALDQERDALKERVAELEEVQRIQAETIKKHRLDEQSEGETESGEETSFDAISDAFFRYCKTHDEEDAKRLLAFMGGMSYAIHPWEAERHA